MSRAGAPARGRSLSLVPDGIQERGKDGKHATQTRLPVQQGGQGRSGGHYARYDLAAVTAVDAEVGVGGEKNGVWKRFGHAHQAGIRETHGYVRILLDECENRV